MSIFDFFKRKKKISVPPVKKYDLENISSLIEEENKNISDKSEKLISEIKGMISQFSSDIKKKISELKLLNLKDRKEEEKLKDLVMVHLRYYIASLEKLTENLEKIDEKEADKYVGKVGFIFNRFVKSSRGLYERATILIGRELAEVRDLTNSFAGEFNKKLESNKENSEKKKLIKTIRNDLSELEETKKIQKQIEDSVSDFLGKISKIEEEKKSAEKNYEEYRKGDESKKFVEAQEKIKQENKITEEDISRLRQEIDFKDLGNKFHDDKKKNNLIKKYSRNFSGALKEDSNLEIISLLKEANQKFDEEKIKALRQKILEQKNLEEDVKVKEFDSLLLKLDTELKYENGELEKEKEKILKFKEKHIQVLSRLEETAKKIWKEFKTQSV